MELTYITSHALKNPYIYRRSVSVISEVHMRILRVQSPPGITILIFAELIIFVKP